MADIKFFVLNKLADTLKAAIEKLQNESSLVVLTDSVLASFRFVGNDANFSIEFKKSHQTNAFEHSVVSRNYQQVPVCSTKKILHITLSGWMLEDGITPHIEEILRTNMGRMGMSRAHFVVCAGVNDLR